VLVNSAPSGHKVQVRHTATTVKKPPASKMASVDEANALTAGRSIRSGGSFLGDSVSLTVVDFPGLVGEDRISLLITALSRRGPSDEFEGVRAVLVGPDGQPAYAEAFNKIGQLSFLDVPDADYRVRFEI
jgi:hypothetical protein